MRCPLTPVDVAVLEVVVVMISVIVLGVLLLMNLLLNDERILHSIVEYTYYYRILVFCPES